MRRQPVQHGDQVAADLPTHTPHERLDLRRLDVLLVDREVQPDLPMPRGPNCTSPSPGLHELHWFFKGSKQVSE